MSQGLEENRMHSEHSADLDLDLDLQTRPEIQHTEQKMSTFIGTTRSAKITTTAATNTNTMKKQHGKNSRSSWSTSQKKLDIRSGPEIIISGLETLGHHDDFYNTDSDLLSRPSGSFSFASSTSTQFNSALSHFDSSTSTSAMVDVLSPSQDRLNPNPASTPPPSSFTSPAGSGSTIPLAECVISPQMHAAALPVAAVPVVNPFDVGGKEQNQEQEQELAKLRTENAVLKLRAENAALKAKACAGTAAVPAAAVAVAPAAPDVTSASISAAHVPSAMPVTPVSATYQLGQHQQQQQQYIQRQQYLQQQQYLHQQQQQQQQQYLMQQQYHQQQLMLQQRQSMPSTLISRAAPTTSVDANTRKSMDCALLLKLNGNLRLKQPTVRAHQQRP